MFETFGVTEYQNFLIASISIILLPGPNSIYVLSIASRYGVKSGYKGALGVFVGDSILMLLTILGAASVLKSMPYLFNILKFAGGIYLGYLGVIIAINAIKSNNSNNVQDKIPILKPQKKIFFNALYISLINPKAILFFLAFFIQYINPKYPIWQPSIILAITILSISFLYLSLLIFSGKNLAIYFQKHIALKILGNLAIGSLFIFFSFKLLTAQLI